MRSFLIYFLTVFIVFISCNAFGEKLSINDHSEVYYKGPGITEADASRLGNFLLSRGYFNDIDNRTVHLSKENDSYVVTLVIEKERLKLDENEIAGFRVWQMWLEDSVFNGQQTRLVLADSALNHIKDVGEFTDLEKLELNTGISVAADSLLNEEKDLHPL